MIGEVKCTCSCSGAVDEAEVEVYTPRWKRALELSVLAILGIVFGTLATIGLGVVVAWLALA